MNNNQRWDPLWLKKFTACADHLVKYLVSCELEYLKKNELLVLGLLKPIQK